MEPLLPNFLIAGVQKGGTCSAARNLCRHPNVRVSRAEVHFFNKNWDKGIEWYHRKMHKINYYKPHALLGDKTPNYFDNHLTHHRMMSVVPNAKIIILLRNPATRFISQWLMHKREKPHVLPLEDLVEQSNVFFIEVCTSNISAASTSIFQKSKFTLLSRSV